MNLTEKQKRFADYVIKTDNATQSYIDAGYKATTRKVAEANARKLLAKHSVKKYIEERLARMEDERIADAVEVMRFLSDSIRGEVEEEVVVVENTGDFSSEARIVKKQISAKDRIKAAELLGKRYAMWTDKQQIDGVVGVQVVDDIGGDLDDDNEC